MFYLGRASEQNLTGVDPRLDRCVRRAIGLCSVDFTVFEGLRSLERQQKLVREGVSRTLDSYHLDGHAVDLVPWISGRAQWQGPACLQVLLAMREAALHFQVAVTCGAVWDRRIDELDPRRLEDEIDQYIARYKAKHGPKARPLIDLPHYQVDR